jgi:hypothetical protein
VILLNDEQIQLIRSAAEDLANLAECNCPAPKCIGTCAHALALTVQQLLSDKTNQDSPEAEAYRESARAHYQQDGEIEIDENAIVSMGDDPRRLCSGVGLDRRRPNPGERR